MTLKHSHRIDPLDMCSPNAPCAECLADPNRPTTAVIGDQQSPVDSLLMVCEHEDPAVAPTPPAPAPANSGPSTTTIVVVAVIVVVVGWWLLSDARVKRDVSLLYWLPNGIGVYRYRYRWSDRVYIGVIAQEVAELVPDAVRRGPDGYLRVNYARLGLNLLQLDRRAFVERPA